MMTTSCPSCGKPATARKLPRYRYRESGLPNVWLRGGVTEFICSACGEKHIRIHHEPQLLQVIALSLLTKRGPLTGPEMRFLRGACEMSQAELAKALDCRRETVAEREAKANPALSHGDEVWLRLILLDSFRSQLKARRANHLTARQLRRLERFAAHFTVEALKLVQQMVRRLLRKMEMRHSGELWQLDKAA